MVDPEARPPECGHPPRTFGLLPEVFRSPDSLPITIAMCPVCSHSRPNRPLAGWWPSFSSRMPASLGRRDAYRGHWKSCRDSAEREQIRKIEEDEWHHRRLVRNLLTQLNAHPRLLREIRFFLIGRTLGVACRFLGWFIPMYAAGRLESHNVREYEDAADYALACGHPEMLDCLLTMAEVEWDHEKYFRGNDRGSSLAPLHPVVEGNPSARSDSGQVYGVDPSVDCCSLTRVTACARCARRLQQRMERGTRDVFRRRGPKTSRPPLSIR